MGFHAWLTLALVLLSLVLLVRTRLAPEFILGSALAVLVFSGAVEPAQALTGFSNPGLITVGLLFVV
ncbi:MAG TPA: hypothetical protein VJN01_02190, partial [Xanthomonadales bacterium]|nr:hypothetical protein [Xanthomonadales bacterium]